MLRLKKFAQWLSDHSQRTDSVLEWWVFPSLKTPRFLIPTNKSYWDAGLHFVQSKEKRIALKVLLTIYRLTRRKSDLSIRASLPQQLTDNLSGDPYHLAGYVSTASRFSKYTFAVLDSDGKILAYAKLAEGKDAPAAIESEVMNLKLIQERLPSCNFYPVILFSDSGFSLQTPAPVLSKGPLAQKAGKMSATIFASKRSEVTWINSENRKILLKSSSVLQRFKKLKLSQSLVQIDQILIERTAEISFEQGFNHGDFVSWNLINSYDGFVFDWEWSSNLIEFYDLFQFLWFKKFSNKRGMNLKFLLNLWTEKDGRDILRGYNSDKKEVEEPLLIHAAIYCATSYAFHCEHCTANNDEPDNYPFLRNLRNVFFEIMDQEDVFAKIKSFIEK